MSEANKYPVISREDAYIDNGLLVRIREIVEMAIESKISVDEMLSIIQREVKLIDDQVSLNNRKARDKIVRRELGLDDSVILTGREYAAVFSLWKKNPED
ncbi:hypothetical protein ACQFG6_003607 [Klebsiella michiganensis]|uniref:Uncharacterized protein n=1 Tax=Klebsiella michiganensis TaxID=1134687 RepID=A0AB35WBR6_9ENTR|nr:MULTISPECIES: hypothetical protein [Enterobacteriaceae]APM34712.1 hypothetical protein AGH21_30795 [Klebsiella oxytoca]AUU97159.1 hypothetical protein C2U49_21380 [Klebsiella pneumoniae]EWF61530.1 hypothetical protein L387_04995 [Klebsiella michiganensis]KLY31018.1 hypothetical protein SK91_03307 [Klebsiella michiganensis]MBM7228448.1 hypothetical protein [Klebsiella michiganensis]